MEKVYDQHIRGYHPPGREWQARDERYDNIHVGIQIGKQPHGLVAGDAESPSWTIPVEVVTREEGLDFRGPSVQGGRGERFIYLTWGDVGEDGSFAMFRRAKPMLSELEAFVGNAESVIARVKRPRFDPRVPAYGLPSVEWPVIQTQTS